MDHLDLFFTGVPNVESGQLAALSFHPLANIFPLLDGQPFADLVADIAAHGVREPIWLYNGEILDGRNRYRAAYAAGMDCPSREYRGDNPAAFVVSLNLHRRHLSESQRAMVAAKLANLDRGRPENNPPIGGLSQPNAAALLNVGERSVQRAREVLTETPPEVAQAVERGDLAVSLAAQVADMPSDTKGEIANEIAAQPADAAKIVRAHVANNSGENEWYTPPEFIEAAVSVLGNIDTDPASCATANEVVKATQFFSLEEDGLNQEWRGNVWMNPPYESALIGRFIDKLCQEYESGRVTSAIVLVNNATETRWFQQIADMAAAVCFPASRIRFWHPTRGKGAPLQGQAFIYLGKHIEPFITRFAQFGFCLVTPAK